VREQFAVWYPRTAEEREQFIMDGLVAVDANVLLHFYRMTSEVREDILALLGCLGERLWIPHQVGLEFHRNRLNVIREQEQTEQKIRAAVDEAAERINQVINGFRNHPAIDRAALRAAANSGLSHIRTYLDTVSIDSYLSVKTAMRSEKVLDSITSLFEGKVGAPYPADQMIELEAEARHRFEEQIPPGYADAKKDTNRQCGDYILWRQLLDEAAKRKLPVLFVTNDQKEDWYRRIHGLTAGPRFELVTEMHQEAGVAFHAQTLALFVDTAPSSLRSPVKDTTVAEVIRLDEFDRTSFRADRASDLAERDLGQHAMAAEYDQAAAGKVQLDPRNVQTVRLKARHDELSLRVAELQSELKAEQRREGASDGAETSDPRSYVRALQARIDASSRLLEETTNQLSTLEDKSTPQPLT